MNYTYDPEQISRIISYYNPSARAVIAGSIDYPDIFGEVRFYKIKKELLIVTILENLPKDNDGFLGFTIHNGESCSGNAKDSFANTGEIYNPKGETSVKASGVFPPILQKDSSAFLAFVTDKVTIPEITRKTVVINSNIENKKSTGFNNEKIACGEIIV